MAHATIIHMQVAGFRCGGGGERRGEEDVEAEEERTGSWKVRARREVGLRNRSSLEGGREKRREVCFENWMIYEYSTGTVPLPEFL
jgi:hypothetical protein